MNASKTFFVLLLSVTTIGGAVLSWRQYRELVELRALALNRDDRADLLKRIAQLEKANRELQDRVTAARTNAGDDVDELVAAVTERQPGDARARGPRDSGRGEIRGGRGADSQREAAMRELMNKPEVQAMLAQQQKAAIEARYAALFKNLNLNPEQAEKLKTLLADRQTSVADVMEAARAQGINPRENPEAMRKMIADARNQVESGIKTLLGDAGYSQLQSYEQTLPHRNLVNELQQRLTYSNTPLTSQQAEQLVQILAANAPQGQASTRGADTMLLRGGFNGPGGFDGPVIRTDFGFGPALGGDFRGPPGASRGGSAVITSNAVAQAQGVLSQPQIAALQQLQQQQQAQQQLRQMVSDTLAANQPQRGTGKSDATANSGATNPAAGTAGTPPTRRRGSGGG